MTHTCKILILSILLHAVLSAAVAQPDTGATYSKPTIFDYLGREEMTDIEIETDISYLIENKNTDDYIKGTLEIRGPGRFRQELEMKVKPRGKFRRRICDFPPLKLKFSKKMLRGMGLDTFNNLKLVTHCLDDKVRGNENVLKEYLAYQLFNILSETGLRVQLVRIRYRDPNGAFPNTRRYGFLIEDDEELAFRNHGVLCECYNQPDDRFDARQREVVALFQYMIGNTDWDVDMNRNVEVVDRGPDQPMLVVPYDFDFSGMVQSGYAIPTPGLGLKNVAERHYLGKAPDSLAREVRAHFRSRREAILDHVRSFRTLSAVGRDEVTTYLESFFREIALPENQQSDRSGQ